MFLIILAVLFVIFVVETVLTEVEHWGWATALLVATLVGCHFVSPDLDPLDFVKAHGLFTLVYVLAYVGVGVAWSFVKWFSFLRNFRDTFRQHKENFCKGRSLNPAEPVPEPFLEAFKTYLAGVRYSVDSSIRDGLTSLERPRAAHNKRRITAWMAYWPCSVIGTFLNDPVRRLFNWTFNHFKALYQKLADHVFRKDVDLK